LAVNRNVPATTLAELIGYARAHPGRLTYGSGGSGSTSSLGAELLKAMAGVDMVHVPYRGSAPSISALVSGEIDIMFADLSLLAPHAKAGTLRLIAAAGARRASVAPELPTVAEQGLPGFAIEPWYGVVVPAGTPPDIVAKLAGGLHEVIRAPEIGRRFGHVQRHRFDRRQVEILEQPAKLRAFGWIGSCEENGRAIGADFATLLSSSPWLPRPVRSCLVSPLPEPRRT